jgi:hypothetical protein
MAIICLNLCIKWHNFVEESAVDQAAIAVILKQRVNFSEAAGTKSTT